MRCTVLTPMPSALAILDLAVTSHQAVPDGVLNLDLHGWSSKPDTPGACPVKAGVHPLSDHAAFEFGEHGSHLQHCPAVWRGGVHPFLIGIDCHASGVEFGKSRCNRRRGPAKAIN